MHNQIIICNVDNESMLGDIESVPTAVFESTAIISFRLLWLANIGDIVVLPRQPPYEFLEYMKNIIDVDFSLINFIVPNENSKLRFSITGTMLLSCEVLDTVKKYIVGIENKTWHLLPYYFTPAVGKFGHELAQVCSLPQSPFNVEGGAELLNQKTVFRKIAAGIGVPFALGEIARDVNALSKTIEHFIKHTGTVIIKQDKSGGGEGNYAITSTEQYQFMGVAKTLHLSKYTIAEASLLAITELATIGNESLTVEVYYNTSTVVYSEYYLDEHGTTKYLNHGTMRMWPLWSGFEIPGHIPPKAQADFIHHSTKIASFANMLGYQGHLNIDAIVTHSGDVIFTEINGRTGGCTHVHAVAQHLLGPNYLNTYQITTFNKSFVRSFQDYTNLLTERDLHFSKQTGRGVIILSADQRLEGVALELMFIGSDIEETQKVESIARMLADSVRMIY